MLQLQTESDSDIEREKKKRDEQNVKNDQLKAQTKNTISLSI